MHMPVTRDLSLHFEEVFDISRFRLALAGALLCLWPWVPAGRMRMRLQSLQSPPNPPRRR